LMGRQRRPPLQIFRKRQHQGCATIFAPKSTNSPDGGIAIREEGREKYEEHLRKEQPNGP
jgi:hypothetical protein